MQKYTRSIILLLILCITLSSAQIIATVANQSNGNDSNIIIPNSGDSSTEPSWATEYYQQVKGLVSQVVSELNNVD